MEVGSRESSSSPAADGSSSLEPLYLLAEYALHETLQEAAAAAESTSITPASTTTVTPATATSARHSPAPAFSAPSAIPSRREIIMGEPEGTAVISTNTAVKANNIAAAAKPKRKKAPRKKKQQQPPLQPELIQPDIDLTKPPEDVSSTCVIAERKLLQAIQKSAAQKKKCTRRKTVQTKTKKKKAARKTNGATLGAGKTKSETATNAVQSKTAVLPTATTSRRRRNTSPTPPPPRNESDEKSILLATTDQHEGIKSTEKIEQPVRTSSTVVETKNPTAADATVVETRNPTAADATVVETRNPTAAAAVETKNPTAAAATTALGPVVQEDTSSAGMLPKSIAEQTSDAANGETTATAQVKATTESIKEQKNSTEKESIEEKETKEKAASNDAGTEQVTQDETNPGESLCASAIAVTATASQVRQVSASDETNVGETKRGKPDNRQQPPKEDNPPPPDVNDKSVKSAKGRKGSNGVVSEDSEIEIPPELKAFRKGTNVKKFFEKQGHWLSGRILENKKKEPTAQLYFEADDDDESIEESIGDTDALSKMVRLGKVSAGARIAVYWPDDDMYYPATVVQERSRVKKAFFVKYDDGMHEWINLWTNEFQVLSEDEDPANANHPRRRRRNAKMGNIGTTGSSKSTKRRRASELDEGDESDTGRSIARKKRQRRAATEKQLGWFGVAERSKRKRKAVNRWSMEDNLSDKDRRLMMKSRDNSSSDRQESGDDSDRQEEESNINSVVSKRTRRVDKRKKEKSSKKESKSTPSIAKKKKAHEGYSKKWKAKRRFLEEDDSDTEAEVSDSPIVNASTGGDLVDSSADESNTKPKDVTRLSDVSIGVRVSILWTDDEKFYTGTVKKRRNGSKPFFVEYDDGDDEWLDLSMHTFRIIQRGRKQLKPYTPSAKKAVSVKDTTPRKKSPSKSRNGRSSSPSGRKTTPTARRKRSSSPPSSPSTRSHSPEKSNPKSTAENGPDVTMIRVGSRVSVWWPEDRRYYKGTVTRKQPDANWRPFFLEYDDGDEEWIDFRHHKFRILSPEEEKQKADPSTAKVKVDGRNADVSRVWIGSRLSVWWPEEQEYFDCCVTRYRDHKRAFYLEYDDGDREWIDLEETEFFIVDSSPVSRRKSA